MLDLEMDRAAVAPRDAATLVLVRAEQSGMEVFCVERHKKSAFLGGAIVFPGGKVDETDRDPAWATRATPPRHVAAEPCRSAANPATRGATPFAKDELDLRALAVAACREALEEAAILPLSRGSLTHQELLALRATAKETSLLACLSAGDLTVDLAALHPLARWVTPTAEARRFDTRFFLAVAPDGQPGAHDDRETTASFWASPRVVLDRFLEGSVQLAPPTHRTLELLASVDTTEAAVQLASRTCLDPVCPRLVRHVDGAVDTLALALPGDPEHDVREPRLPGATRFILKGDRWLPGCAPR